MKIKTSISRILKILLTLLLVLFCLLRFEIIGQPMFTMAFRYSDKKINKLFKGENRSPKIGYHEFESHTIRYLELIGDLTNPYVVFVHGAPGSSADYIDYFRDEVLFSNVNLISIDRLGYGYSEFGKSETSIQKQAASIQSVLRSVTNTKNIILVGHSFGGPIVLRLAMDFPNAYKQVIMLAPANDPENEKIFKIGRLASSKLTRWITPLALRVAADEKDTHVEELKKMLPLYEKLQIPILHIHGTKDSLVPYANLNFSIKHINPNLLETMTLEDTDHFLPWTNHELVVEKILGSIQK